MAADVSVAAARLSEASGTAKVTPLAQSSINQLTTQVAIAAGVPVVTEAVGKAWRLRGGLATGWPAGLGGQVQARSVAPAASGSAGRADSVRRLIPRGRAYVVAGNFRGPEGTVDTAVRTLADQAAQGLTRGWSDEIKGGSLSGGCVARPCRPCHRDHRS